MKALGFLFLLLVAGCATSYHYAKWPIRGPMFEVTNPTAVRQVIAVRDGLGRVLTKATLAPQTRTCFRWPFIDGYGYLLAAGADTIVTGRFEPWTADGWAWALDGDPLANPKVCR